MSNCKLNDDLSVVAGCRKPIAEIGRPSALILSPSSLFPKKRRPARRASRPENCSAGKIGCHSMRMASSGQTSTHVPQSLQVSGSTTAFSSFMEIASTGHDSTQVSQPVHFSGSMIVAMTDSTRKKQVRNTN
jgi:hypothetical protein